METKNASGIGVNHAYKRTGKYALKLVRVGEGGIGGSSVSGMGTSDELKIYVVKRADLAITGITKNYKGKNVLITTVNVKNKGSVTSKACYLTASYDNKYLKKYKRTATVKSLRPGQSTKVALGFQIPSKYTKQVKSIKVDSTDRVYESIKSNNQVKFTG